MRSLAKLGAKAPTGAPLLIIVTLLIVFYVLFLPPADRAALLGETVNTGSSGGTSGSAGVDNTGDRVFVANGDDYVFEGPGKVSEQTRDEYQHDISPFYLRGEFEASVIASSNDFLVERSVFSSNPFSLDFLINDVDNVDNLILTFQVEQAESNLRIYLNNRQVYSGQATDFNQLIPIDTVNLVSGVNYLRFETDSPGIAFWNKNTYQLSNVELKADVLETGQLESHAIFELRENEVDNLERIRLRYFPDCDEEDGRLSAYINGDRLFSKFPDCDVLNFETIPESMIRVGQNTLRFEATQGSFLIDRVQIQTELEEDEGYTYFFEINDDLFNEVVETEALCGEIDGACPDNCDADVDKDCCFDEYANAYWCDVPTQFTSDRCVGDVTTSIWSRCPSGYEDERGRVPDDFEDLCGDDNDNVCPQGCSSLYDEDCCLVDNSDNFFCEDLPTLGVAYICLAELSRDQCEYCPSGYKAEGSSSFSCNPVSRASEIEDVRLKSNYEVDIEFIFVDDGYRKQAEVLINGYEMSIDTRQGRYSRDISQFVVDNSNYLRVVPKNDFTLVEIRVDIDEN